VQKLKLINIREAMSCVVGTNDVVIIGIMIQRNKSKINFHKENVIIIYYRKLEKI